MRTQASGTAQLPHPILAFPEVAPLQQELEAATRNPPGLFSSHVALPYEVPPTAHISCGIVSAFLPGWVSSLQPAQTLGLQGDQPLDNFPQHGTCLYFIYPVPGLSNQSPDDSLQTCTSHPSWDLSTGLFPYPPCKACHCFSGGDKVPDMLVRLLKDRGSGEDLGRFPPEF